MTASREQLAVVTERIAFFLNEGEKSEVWKVKDTDGAWGVITGPNRAQLYLTLAGRLNRETGTYTHINVGGSFHVGKNGTYVEVYEKGLGINSGWNKASVPSINIAYSKGAQKIAQEIKRRFLPEYLRVLALALDKVAKDDAFEKARHLLLTSCLQLCGKVEAPREDAKGKGWANLTEYDPDSTRGILTANFECSSTEVDLKLDNLTFDEVKHIITYLKGNRRTK